jgi:hypothetical protein
MFTLPSSSELTGTNPALAVLELASIANPASSTARKTGLGINLCKLKILVATQSVYRYPGAHNQLRRDSFRQGLSIRYPDNRSTRIRRRFPKKISGKSSMITIVGQQVRRITRRMPSKRKMSMNLGIFGAACMLFDLRRRPTR